MRGREREGKEEERVKEYVREWRGDGREEIAYKRRIIKKKKADKMRERKGNWLEIREVRREDNFGG